jgi:hypothetical protein
MPDLWRVNEKYSFSEEIHGIKGLIWIEVILKSCLICRRQNMPEQLILKFQEFKLISEKP